MLVHELRNPLVGIEASARVLARELGTHPSSRRAAAIAEEARHLIDLLESLADVESLESGRMSSILRPVDLSALIRAAAAAMHLPEHPIALRAADEPVMVEADDRRVRQVLKNLVANAAQYAPVGTKIEVTVGVDRRRKMGTVEVLDHGPGIPPLERRQLFRKFARLSTAGGTRGSGLGLYICQKIADDHGGELRADFPATGGSAFSLRVPLTVESKRVTARRPVRRAETARRRVRRVSRKAAR